MFIKRYDFLDINLLMMLKIGGMVFKMIDFVTICLKLHLGKL